jgi:hypothetical protein
MYTLRSTLYTVHWNSYMLSQCRPCSLVFLNVEVSFIFFLLIYRMYLLFYVQYENQLILKRPSDQIRFAENNIIG